MPSETAVLLDRVQRVLLIRLRSLGDAVLMTPVPSVLKRWRPSLHVAVLIEEPFAAVFHRHPAVDEIVAVAPGAGFAERARWLGRIRGRFDAVVNLHSGSTAGLLTALSGAKLRVAYARARFAALCNVRVPGPEAFFGVPPVHTVIHQLTPLRCLGLPVPERPELELHPDPAARVRVQGQMRQRGLRRGGFVVMQPFSGWATKEWAPERFAALARELRRRHGLPILALPAPGENGKLVRLLALGDGAIDALAGVPVDEMIAWIDECGLLIGNDSGPAHVAAALRKPNVVIFGSADPQVWRPWAGRHEVLSAGLPCVPCAGDRCYEFSSPRCLEAVTVDQALDAVERVRSSPQENAPGPRDPGAFSTAVQRPATS